MTLQETIGLRLIKLFVHPIPRDDPVDFKTRLKQATRVLISCPTGKEISCHSTIVAKFASLFPREGLVVLCPGSEKYSPEKYRIERLLSYPITFPDIPKHSLWNLVRCKSLKQLNQHRFDALLDLDPDFSLLNVYLCRLLHSPVRIGFTKPHSNRLYNIQYNGKPGVPYAKRLEGLLQLLQSLLS